MNKIQAIVIKACFAFTLAVYATPSTPPSRQNTSVGSSSQDHGMRSYEHQGPYPIDFLEQKPEGQWQEAHQRSSRYQDARSRLERARSGKSYGVEPAPYRNYGWPDPSWYDKVHGQIDYRLALKRYREKSAIRKEVQQIAFDSACNLDLANDLLSGQAGLVQRAVNWIDAGVEFPLHGAVLVSYLGPNLGWKTYRRIGNHLNWTLENTLRHVAAVVTNKSLAKALASHDPAVFNHYVKIVEEHLFNPDYVPAPPEPAPLDVIPGEELDE